MNNKICAFAFKTASILMLTAMLLAACVEEADTKSDSQSGPFTVTFSNIGSAVIEPQTVEKGKLAQKPADPVITGFKFNGWFFLVGSNLVQFDFTSPITGDLALYAQWTRIFTVTFNDGIGSPSASQVETGSVVTRPADPIRDGYHFDGWFVLNGTAPFNFSTLITADIILYARWTEIIPDSVRVTFDADGGNVSPEFIQVATGAQAGVLPVPFKDNSYFDGWFTFKNGMGMEFTSSSIISAPITLYAKWGTFAAGSNNVVFYSNGGTHVAARLNVPSGAVIEAPVTPTRENFAFDGWYKDQALSMSNRWYFAPSNPADAFRGTGDKVNGNITLYAKWLPVGGPADSGMYSSSGQSYQLHVGRTTGNNSEAVNRIYNSNGKEIRLVGANVPSLDWGTGENVGHLTYELFANWNANVVRLCVVPNRWSDSYKATVDRVVALANSFGKYVILDNHEYVSPTQQTLNFWKDAAVRYKDNPAVLFGLLNEPHSVSWDIWLNGGVREGVTHIGHQQLVNEIRALDANNIIVAGGLEWGYSLAGISANNFARILVDTPDGRGIMYDSHAYPWKDDNQSFSGHATRVLSVAVRAPVLIGEFGIEEEGLDVTGWAMNHTVKQMPWYMETVLNWMETHGLHFTAWNFHPNSTPRMVLGDSNWNARQNITPNQFFGQQVYARLKSYPNTNSHLNPIPARPINGN